MFEIINFGIIKKQGEGGGANKHWGFSKTQKLTSGRMFIWYSNSSEEFLQQKFY